MDISKRSDAKNNQFKIILLGDSSVGKTSILTKYMDGKFVEYNGTKPTLAWDFKIKNIKVNTMKRVDI